ncbi:barstar family protein [Chitinibacter fontanus]|uniref:Barstar family protein n=1 Tax=Chitinibacter fontanus TaxID=1737446 RepID=A0A7D5ZFR1_9NEIS|nr:barstar family protein [Chitinibacter fontanus]QLI82806.1 barstar family protein [Chitinibacter fontanus]
MSVGLHIHLRNISNLNDFYDQLTQQANLNRGFGRNLDALFDVLTTDLAGPICITWHGCEQSKQAMTGTQFADLMSVLNDAAAERVDLTIHPH